MKTNMRLLKQSTEKDDMNAKSLSTILHLKSLTEQYDQEKVIREQEAKNVEQISLAARLAANAKDRVTEEVIKEKKVRRSLQFCNYLSYLFFDDLSRHAVIRYYQLLEDRAKELEKECERSKCVKEDADGALSRTRAEMSSLETSVGTVKDRCEELTT